MNSGPEQNSILILSQVSLQWVPELDCALILIFSLFGQTWDFLCGIRMNRKMAIGWKVILRRYRNIVLILRSVILFELILFSYFNKFLCSLFMWRGSEIHSFGCAGLRHDKS